MSIHSEGYIMFVVHAMGGKERRERKKEDESI
jgi:hypothetical protein